MENDRIPDNVIEKLTSKIKPEKELIRGMWALFIYSISMGGAPVYAIKLVEEHTTGRWIFPSGGLSPKDALEIFQKIETSAKGEDSENKNPILFFQKLKEEIDPYV